MKQLLIVVVVCFGLSVITAQNNSIQWLSFEALEVALNKTPKKVFIHFYADWCQYCKKMENTVYTKSNIKNEITTNYYAVKLNVTSKDTIVFGGKTFVNKNIAKRRLPYHEIAELLAFKAKKSLELPTLVFFDKDFIIKQRYFTYLPPKKFLSILKSN